MKNIVPGLFFLSAFLPHASFGAIPGFVDPQVAACNQKLDSQSSAFWSQQAQDRAAFIKANPTSISNHEKHFKAMLAIDMARRTGKSTTGLTLPPGEDTTFAAFQQKQQSDKAAFLAQLYQQQQNCSNHQTITTPTLPGT